MIITRRRLNRSTITPARGPISRAGIDSTASKEEALAALQERYAGQAVAYADVPKGGTLGDLLSGLPGVHSDNFGGGSSRPVT